MGNLSLELLPILCVSSMWTQSYWVVFSFFLLSFRVSSYFKLITHSENWRLTCVLSNRGQSTNNTTWGIDLHTTGNYQWHVQKTWGEIAVVYISVYLLKVFNAVAINKPLAFVGWWWEGVNVMFMVEWVCILLIAYFSMKDMGMWLLFSSLLYLSCAISRSIYTVS